MDIKQSKSILARLLATENLTVEHKNISTAYFDVKNRVLALPTWKEMSTDVYDLLVGHEVGHALYTPAAGWHDSVTDQDYGDHFKGFLNVLEDARIEKLIKRRYPGIRKNFFKAYEELHASDLFGVKDRNINKMLLIDRINLHFKIGPFLNVQFSAEERDLVKEVEALETWEQVVELAERLYARAEQELENLEDMQNELDLLLDQGGTGNTPDDVGDSEDGEAQANPAGAGRADYDGEIKSLTDQHFRKHEAELVDEKSRPYEYFKLETWNSTPYIWKYKDMLSYMQFEPDQEAQRSKLIANFKIKNNKFINYLVKEFELKRNADQWLRAKVSKTGEIDVKKVFKYNFSEDLFLKITQLPNGKNHGLLMFYDMSGSMSGYIHSVIEQILILVEFCRKVNIPYEVYGFTNCEGSWSDKINENYFKDESFVARLPDFNPGHLLTADFAFRLQQYFTDQMSGPEYKQMQGNLIMVAKSWQNRFCRSEDRDWSYGSNIPACERLQSTPLNETILLSTDIFNKFKARTKAQVVNMVYLTDGQADRSIRRYKHPEAHEDVNQYTIRGSLINPVLANCVITHEPSKISKLVKRSYTNTFLEIVRELTGANIVGFYLTNNVRNTVSNIATGERWLKTPEQEAQIDAIMDKHRRDRVAVVTTAGFNEYYVVHHKNMSIEDEELEVDAGAEKKDILRAFRQMQKGKLLNRVLLNRFIGMIA